MILYPNCKINLGLRVIRKRPDGYHDLETVFVPVYGLHDELEICQQPIANSQQLTIDPRVAPLLADHLGTDLSAIVGALQKLIDGRPQGVTTIDAALVERNIGISKDYNIMELQAALIRGDVARANRITQYFAGSKDHPMIREMAPLFTFFSNLLMYHYLPDKSQGSVAKELGINPYFVKDYVTAARRYPAGKTFLIIGYLRDTDARLKGINNPSAKDADLWKELIYKIMH